MIIRINTLITVFFLIFPTLKVYGSLFPYTNKDAKSSSDYGIPADFIDKIKNQTSSFYLKNKIKVVHHQSDFNNTAIKWVLDWDSNDYQDERELIRPFFAKLIAKQTKDYGIHATNRLFTTKFNHLACSPNNSCFQGGKVSCEAIFSKENLSYALVFLKSMITKPEISDIHLQTAKKNALIDYKKCQLDQKWQSYRSHFKIKHSPITFLKTYYDLEPFIKKITSEKILSEYQKFFNGQRMHFTVVGANSTSTIKDSFNYIFGDIPSSPYVKSSTLFEQKWSSPIYYDHQKIAINYQPTDTVFVTINTNTTGSKSAHREGFELLFFILNKNFYELIRIKHGLSYNPSARFNSRSGVFSFSTNNLDKTMELTKGFIQQAKIDPLMGKNLEYFKTDFILNFYKGLSSPIKITRIMSFHDITFNSLHRYFNYPDVIAKADIEYLQFLAQQILDDFTLSIRGSMDLIKDHQRFNNYFDPHSNEKFR